MQIKPIPKFNTDNYGIMRGNYVRNNTKLREEKKADYVSCEAYRAKYCPSFGKYIKIGTVQLTDRNSGKPVKADLKCEKYGQDDISYKIYVGNDEAGYMDMKCSSVFPEDNEHVITEPDDNIPEISHLRSILGDKYAGIGSALVNVAVDESKKRGKNGALWLTTEQGYAWTLSKYRAYQNPIPFYYKLGFKAVNPKTDEFIKKCLAKTDFNSLPESEILLLSSDAINEKNKYFEKNYVIN